MEGIRGEVIEVHADNTVLYEASDPGNGGQVDAEVSECDTCQIWGDVVKES
jgi:hypothetical protein